jgi:DNA-binding MarR family transcriptional regulator
MSTLQIENPDVAELAPSEKLVYLVIQEDAPITRQHLHSQTKLPKTTIDNALSTLTEQRLIKRDSNLDDLRRTIYNPMSEEQAERMPDDPEEERSSRLGGYDRIPRR